MQEVSKWQFVLEKRDVIFTLQTKHSSYQMLADDKNVLLHLYYGDKIGEGDELQDLIRRSDMGFSGNPVEAGRDRTYSLDTLPQEIAGFGTGDYRESSVMIEQADKSLAAEFRFAGYEILDGAKLVTGMPGLYDTEEEKGQTLGHYHEGGSFPGRGTLKLLCV